MIANTTLFSNALKTNVNINFFIPTPEGQEQITDSAVQQKYNYEKGLPVVYLLHGAFGNYNSWLRFSCVERYAQKYGCVLVMASAENSFYHDMSRGNSYYTFFSKELPALVQSILPVSRRREDTYIAGFSMGGYGSWYIALNNPQNYCKAASLSLICSESVTCHINDMKRLRCSTNCDSAPSLTVRNVSVLCPIVYKDNTSREEKKGVYSFFLTRHSLSSN